MTKVIDICIFAHNEEDDICLLLEDICKQTIITGGSYDVKFTIAANACSDGTVSLAKAYLSKLEKEKSDCFSVVDLALGGKSRTWNKFTHELSREEAELLMYMDGDIRLHDNSVLEKMVVEISNNDALHLFSSKPVKDVDYYQNATGFVQILISKSGGKLTDLKKAVCGSLHIARSNVIRQIFLPIGLPGEDGFLSAMVKTNALSEPDNFDRVDGGRDDIFHTYESIGTISELIQHQTRLVIGSAVNSALFRYISENGGTHLQNKAILQESASDDSWVAEKLKLLLPKAPYGFVPFHFLTKRISAFLNRNEKKSAKSFLILAIGVVFDVLVYFKASLKMASGHGANYW